MDQHTKQYISRFNELYPDIELLVASSGISPDILPQFVSRRFNNTTISDTLSGQFEFIVDEKPTNEITVHVPLSSYYTTEVDNTVVHTATGQLFSRLTGNKVVTKTFSTRCLTLRARLEDIAKYISLEKVSFSRLMKPCSLLEPNAQCLFRAISYVWSLSTCKGALLSPIALHECEDSLLTALAHWLSKDTLKNKALNERAVSIAEQYLAENFDRPVSRAELQQLTNVSIRTLSRAFEKKYGVGPIEFLQQRRLEAAYFYLSTPHLEKPRVIDVALKCGFNHIGRFSSYYKKTFGETPSKTLSRA